MGPNPEILLYMDKFQALLHVLAPPTQVKNHILPKLEYVPNIKNSNFGFTEKRP